MTNHVSQLIRLVEGGFGKPHVLVIGDVMLDKYVRGEVERISPEAPVPVLRIARQTQHPGGAANVAMNLAELGARVTLMGLGGIDDDQNSLSTLLAESGVKCSLVECPGVPTTTKLRVLAGHQQLLRLDNEPRRADFNGGIAGRLRDCAPGLRQGNGYAAALLARHDGCTYLW